LDLEDITRIVVTHDLEAELLKRYDCILTMKNGQIAERGSFEALMSQKGYFYSLFTVSQA
jgi:ABC-type multidrug transport system fused ATPase/permease subunit